jgi:PAS domain S-box-containing protein
MEELLTEISRIRTLLGDHPGGLSITDISGKLQMNRNSVAKYMDILQIQGAVDGRKQGTSKVYSLSRRLLATSVLKICTRPLVICNQDGSSLDLNPSFTVITSVPREQILNQPFDSLPFKNLEGATLQQVFRAALKGMEQRVRIQILSGEKAKPANLLLVPVVFENGKPGVAVIIDEDTIAPAGPETERTLSHVPELLDNEIEYIVRHTPEGIIQYVNEPYCRAIGRTREDLIGRLFKPILSAEDAERIRVLFSRLTPQYPSGMIEYRTIMANGEAQWQRWWNRALFNDRGEINGFISFGIDISALVETQQKLKKTKETLEESIKNRTDDLREINRQLYEEMARREKMEQQLRHTQFAMDNASDMVFWVNRNGRVQYANIAATGSLGYSSEHLITLTFGEIFPSYTLARWDDAWEELKRAGTLTDETNLLRRDGSQAPVDMAIKYLEYFGDEFAFCFARDISERTRMERALQLANKKFNIISSLTRHDIQNKITVLLGFLGRAKKKEMDPVILEYLNRQEQAAKAIRSEVNMTRDFKDVGSLPPAWLSIKKVVSEAMVPYLDGPIHLESDLPDLEVYADCHLRRVFSRLFENAVKYGNRTTKIDVSAVFEDSHLIINVQDDGGGIPPGEKGNLFSLQEGEFGYRGLFIAQEILSLTGITIQETGEFGKGARFEIMVSAGGFRPAGQEKRRT